MADVSDGDKPLARRLDGVGMAAVILVAAITVPAPVLYLLSFIPELSWIGWLVGLFFIPVAAGAGIIAALLGVVGIVVGKRRGSRIGLSVLGLVLGLVMTLPAVVMFVLPL